MKTREIKIEPGSGTLLAGKNVAITSDEDSLSMEIIFISQKSILVKYENGSEGSWPIENYNWLEVLPGDPPVHEEFFKKIGKLQLRFFVDQNDPCFFYHTAEELYQAFESRILAKLKSEGVVK